MPQLPSVFELINNQSNGRPDNGVNGGMDNSARPQSGNIGNVGRTSVSSSAETLQRRDYMENMAAGPTTDNLSTNFVPGAKVQGQAYSYQPNAMPSRHGSFNQEAEPHTRMMSFTPGIPFQYGQMEYPTFGNASPDNASSVGSLSYPLAQMQHPPIYGGGAVPYDYQMIQHTAPQAPLYYPVYLDSSYYPQAEENYAMMNKRRTIKRRTRTGCLTCRKRRIKCDERKPYCYNCERSKKVCLGYENLSKQNKKKKDSDNKSNDRGEDEEKKS